MLQRSSRMLSPGEKDSFLSGEVFVRMAHVYRDDDQFQAMRTSAQGLLCVLSGSGQLMCNDQELILHKDQYFRYTPGMRLHWSADKVCLLRFTVKGSRAAKRLDQAQILAARVNHMPAMTSRLLMQRMQQIIDGQQRLSRSFPIAFAWEIIDSLSTPVYEAIDHALIIKELIEESFHQNIHINELASRLDVDRSTLFRQFKKRFGQSPKAFLDQLRFTQAQRLLLESKLSITAIAAQSGFNDPEHFSRRFRSEFGMQPSQWRNKH